MKLLMSKTNALWALVLAGFGVCGPASAQDALRDPTMPPSVTAETSDEPARSALGLDGTSVIVRDGKAGLVVGTRVVFPGQKLGAWALERITETEIWLRNGTHLRKISRFSGIQRHDPAQATACSPALAPSAPAQPHSGKTVKRAPRSNTVPTSTQADTPCDVPPTRSSNP
jgi:hypothetical protein